MDKRDNVISLRRWKRERKLALRGLETLGIVEYEPTEEDIRVCTEILREWQKRQLEM